MLLMPVGNLLYSYCSIVAYNGFIINIFGCLMCFIFILLRKQHTRSPLGSDMSYLVDPRPAQPICSTQQQKYFVDHSTSSQLSPCCKS